MSDLNLPTLLEWVNECMSKPSDGASLALPRDGYSDFEYYSAHRLGELADKAATHLVMNGLPVRKAGEKPLIIGICAPSTISWTASCFGIFRMGHAVLILSSRLSDASVSALVDKSGCDALLHGPHRPQIDAAQEVKMLEMLSAEQLESVLVTDDARCNPKIINADEDLVFITHSSGSTSLPKLFPVTNAGTASRLRPEWLANIAPRHKRLYVASAFYNVVGFWMMITCVNKVEPTIYDNDVLPFTSESLINSLKERQPHWARVNPYSLQLIAAKPEGLAELKKPNVKEHVYLKPIDSAGTETGMFEPVALATHPDLNPLVPKADDPPGSFYTGDIVLAHPTKPDRYKVIGRKDDQLKIYIEDRQLVVDACVYENRIKEGIQDVVEEVVLFGQGRDRLGLLVFAQHAAGAQRDTVLERVWDAIEQKINGQFKAGLERKCLCLYQA